MGSSRGRSLVLFTLSTLLLVSIAGGLQSDELLQDDEEFGLEGGRPAADPALSIPTRPPIRGRSDPDLPSGSPDSKSVQFSLEHRFGGSGFSPAGTFTARLKSWSHGGQTLTKLRFSRNALTEEEKGAFERLLKEDGYYTIRVPSNVLNAPGRDFIFSSVRAVHSRDSLDEHFVIHTDGVNIMAVNYGSAGACQYPRMLKYPAKWSFTSFTVLKNSEQAPRTPTFAEELLAGEDGLVEGVKPPEKSFWAKYWMYLIPLVFIVLNAMTQAMNMPEEQAAGQSTQAQRAPSTTVRRR